MAYLRDHSAVNLLDTAASAYSVKPPPRNPRRLQRLRQASSNWCLSTSARGGWEASIDSDTTSSSDRDGYSSSMSTSSNFKLSHFTHERSAFEDISPPSSPDDADGDYGYACDEVSPIDEYDDLASYYMTGARPAPAPKSEHSKDARPQHHANNSFSRNTQTIKRQSFQRFQTRSHQLKPESIGSHKNVANHMTFQDRKMEDIPFPHQQMDVGSQREAWSADDRYWSESAKPTGRERFPSVIEPLAIPQRSTKRNCQFENTQVTPEPLSAIDVPEFLAVPPSMTESRGRDFQLSKMRRGGMILSNPLPKPRHVSDTTGGNSGRPYLQSIQSDLPWQGPAQYSATFSAQSPFGPQLSPNQANNTIRRKPPPLALGQGSHSPSPSPMHQDKPRRISAFLIPPSPEGVKSPSTDSAWVQPPSRFSAISQSTMNADTPLQPNFNDVPAKLIQPTTYSKRHSTLPNQDEIESALMTLTSSQTTATAEMRQEARDEETEKMGHSRNDSQARPASVMSIDKPLPMAPPEKSSVDDRIKHLNAVLTGLAHRRINTIKSIKQMTELMPSDNLMRRSDLVKKREMEKKKVEGLKEELYDIQRQEHELGLKLHRAYKRQEREDAFEPTSLWVRRRAGEWSGVL